MSRVRFAVDTTGMAAAAAVPARGPSPVAEVVDSGWGFVEAAHTLDCTVITAPAAAPAEGAPPTATHSIRLYQLMWLLSGFLVYSEALLPARGLGIPARGLNVQGPLTLMTLCWLLSRELLRRRALTRGCMWMIQTINFGWSQSLLPFRPP